MLIQYWEEFKKKPKSTEQPVSKGIALSVDVTEPCSELNPTLIINQKIDKMQYVYSVSWHRYYFVTELVHAEGRTIVSLKVDHLATYKEEIGNMTAFVTRSSYFQDTNIIDTLTMTKPAGHCLESRIPSPWYQSPAMSKEWYIVQYTGNKGIKTVLMDARSFDKLCDQLWLEWGHVNGMNDLYASVIDPFQYIVNVQRTPAGTLFWEHDTVMTSLHIGKLTVTGVNAFPLKEDDSHVVTTDIFIPKPPNSDTLPFLKSAEYCNYSIRIPGVGWVPLPTDMLYNHTHLQIKFSAEPVTGAMMAEIFLPNTGSICQARGNLTMPWGISTAKSQGHAGVANVGTAGTAIAGAVGSLMKGNLKDAVLGVVTAGASFVDTTVTTAGSYGGTVGLTSEIILQVKYQDLITRNTEEHGGPCMKYTVLKTAPGYLQCEKGLFRGGLTITERDMVNADLTGGFWYE